MGILIESLMSTPGVCPVYDEPGKCPVCGRELRTMHLYSADTSQTFGPTTSQYYAGRTVKSTPVTTHYTNIRPCTACFCEPCYRNEAEGRYRKEHSRKPSPAAWIAGLVFAVIGAAIIIRSMILNEHEVGGLLFFGFVAFGAGLTVFFKRLSPYRKEMKEYLKCRSEGTASSLAAGNLPDDLMASFMTGSVKGKKFMTEKELADLQKQNNPFPFLS